MIRKFIILIILIIFLPLLSACSSTHLNIQESSNSQVLPKVPREFRAAWVATVANINWPSSKDLSVEEQKNESVKILDFLKKNNFNAVILQVRPQADALYKSDLEPWSYFLTGEQGKAPEPYYDPLEFWVNEAHKRGLELHAWLNPYRAHHINGGIITEASVVKQFPDLVVKLETGYWWLDPSKKGTQNHSYNVVMDLVKRYDIDGIHFDDYFYPYPSYNNNKDFPDDESWELYLKNGGKLSRGDWRRENVNNFIERIYKSIKKEKPSVKFGISPFGFWRPFNPPSVTVGFDQYNELYADAKLWLNKGWIDYYTPQLYWPINRIELSFPVLLNWWKSENKKGRHIWPGINIGRIHGEKGIDETVNQIMIVRGMLSKSPGEVHWSVGQLISNPELAKAILDGPYKKPALAPKYPWLSKKKPKSPDVTFLKRNDSLVISWNLKNSSSISHLVVYQKYKKNWDYTITPNYDTSIKIPLYKINLSYLNKTNNITKKDFRDAVDNLNAIAVSSIDKFGNESHVIEHSIPNFDYKNAPTFDAILKLYNQK
ncbi:glycoside hydrolase family 10 protein [Yeosuana marina]|uniref:glycoside hydrolase family 10 protein n=1 Tax=Yeosuana marina TaxID=1565536 RepID=UPI0030C83AA4